MSRSLRVRQKWIDRLKLIVSHKFGSQGRLAEEAMLAPSTVSNFLNGRSVDRATFAELCQRLELDWQELAEVAEVPKVTPQPAANTKLKSLVKTPLETGVDWGEAIDVSIFYGRTTELKTLQQWILNDRCRLVALLGIGGIGKTALSVKLVEQVQEQFEHVIWRSLRNMPPLRSLLTEIILFVSNQQAVDQPDDLEDQFDCLLHYLRQHRCLLVLDNLESILQTEDQARHYLADYEGYGQLLRRISDERHQSCLIITSREKPIGISWREDQQGVVRSQFLVGLSEAAGQAILSDKGLHSDQQGSLVDLYRGNPLALKIAATTIQSIFNGNVSEFLQQETSVFGSIHALIEQQFDRLSVLERQVMYWLTIHRDWVKLTELQTDVIATVPSQQLVEALLSLQERSLIETSVEGFTQQPVVMEYVTAKFVHQIQLEITAQTPHLLQSHALLKAQAKDYIREAQSRAILEPLANQLLYSFGGQPRLEQHLRQLIQTHRQTTSLQPGYLAGNLINLLCHLKTDLTGYDFSNLQIREADLVGVNLHEVNFSGCHFVRSAFSETLTATLSVIFSPDGQYFASGNADGIARIWKISNTNNLVTCKGHGSWVWPVAFSPDSQILATGSFDQTIKLWDVNTGTHLKTFYGHADWILSVAFSPDGQLLASGSNDQTVKLWDVATGQCLRTLLEHTDSVNAAVFSPNSSLLASSSNDNTIKLWDVKSGDLIRSITAHEQHWILSVVFSLDGKYLISGGHDQTIKIWDLATAQCLNILRGHSSYVLSLSLSSDGQTVASSSTDCTVRIWDLATGKCLKVLKGHTNGVWSVAFHPDGQTLISGSNDSMVKVWNAKTGQSLKTIQGYCKGIRSIAFSPDGLQLVSGSDDKRVRLWDVQSSQLLKTFAGHTAWIWSVAFSFDQQLIASSSSDCTIRLWSPDTGKEVQVLQGHVNLVMSIAFSSTDHLLISGSIDHTIRVWNLQTGRCKQTLNLSHRIWSIACSPSGQIVASGSDRRDIQLWDLQTGDCIMVLQGHTAHVFSLALSPDETMLVSGSGDRTVRIWDVRSGKSIHTLTHAGGVWGVAFSNDGKLVASASEDRTVKLWQVETGKCLQTFQHPTGEAWDVAFSPDGNLIAGAGQNGIIHIWNIASGEEIATLGSKHLYEGMNLIGTTGLTSAQYDSLKTLGAYSDS